jgi:putative selenate reductase molybdopterin-binding subunit
MEKKFKVVNTNVEKVDGISLVTGQKVFVDDIDLPGMLVIKMLTSPHAHAIIKDIDTTEAEKLEGVHAVLTYKNVPRVPHTTAGQGYPEPSPYDTYTFDKKVRYVGDRVAAVVAETEEIAECALKLIKVDYEVLPAIFDAKDALKEGAPVIHDEEDATFAIHPTYDPKKNICAHVKVEVGDFDKAFSESEYKLEREYSSHYAQHSPIEPHSCIGYLDEKGRIVLRTSTQVPFHARRIAAQVTGVPIRNIRVVKPRIGGGFGTKQEVLLEDVVAFAVLRTKRPVKWILTRSEEITSSRTRHPMYVKIRLGMSKAGKITALEMDVLSNTGAYGSHGLTVMSNCGSKTLPLYPCDHVRFIGTTVYTNLPVAGAYRGYGATQAVFALESALNEAAADLGIDPVELRRMNHVHEGEGSPIFEKLGEGKEGVAQTIESCGLPQCIDWAVNEIEWGKKSEPSSPYKKRGKGLAVLMQGSSIPYIDMGAAFIKMNEDGSFNLHVGATDLGTGSDTVLSQIAAEVLGVTEKEIIVYSSDTDFTPFDVGAYASSTTYLSGNAVFKTAQKVKEQILQTALKMEGITAKTIEELYLEDGYVKRKGFSEKVSLADVCNFAMYTHDQFQIAACESHISHKSPPPFAAHFVEVEVDTLTGKVDIIKYVAAVDCGTPIHPMLADGQTQGAVVNGIGFALHEEYIFNEKGKVMNDSFDYYKIPSCKDIPEIKTTLIKTYEESGPYGAKSVSEISINGALPAIAHAIYDATGVFIREAPFTPEKVYKALKAAGKI